MSDEAEEELRELLGRAALAQEETGRILADIARKQSAAGRATDAGHGEWPKPRGPER